MASFATLHADRTMFKSKWTSFIRMTFDTSLLVGLGMFHHPLADTHSGYGGGSPVGIVAIRALHEAFVDPMFKGHGELRFYAGVTSHA